MSRKACILGGFRLSQAGIRAVESVDSNVDGHFHTATARERFVVVSSVGGVVVGRIDMTGLKNNLFLFFLTHFGGRR